MNLTVDEHRELVKTHLEYIKEQVDNNAIKLDKLNGRVRKNETAISFIKGVGSLVALMLGGIIGWFEIK
tara:strand:+ start:9635 stop:9841 length:207 start_codon:yes stop_codon:yes gene_type:complete